jgi:putative flippase GtrA
LQIVRYFCVGGVAACVDVAIFALLINLAGLHYLAAGAAGFLVATWVNYVLSVRHVFAAGARFSRSREVIAVYAVSAIGLIWNQVALYVGVEIVALNVYLAKVSAIALVFFWNYFSRKHFVFATGDRSGAP